MNQLLDFKGIASWQIARLRKIGQVTLRNVDCGVFVPEGTTTSDGRMAIVVPPDAVDGGGDIGIGDICSAYFLTSGTAGAITIGTTGGGTVKLRAVIARKMVFIAPISKTELGILFD